MGSIDLLDRRSLPGSFSFFLGFFLSGFSLMRFPVRGQMDLTTRLVLVVNVPPIIDTLVYAKSRDLKSELTDKLIRGKRVLGKDFEGNIISNVLNVDFKNLLPRRADTTAINNLGLEFLHSSVNLAVRVHGTESISITSKSSLMDVESERTRGRSGIAGSNRDGVSHVGVHTTHI